MVQERVHLSNDFDSDFDERKFAKGSTLFQKTQQRYDFFIDVQMLGLLRMQVG